MSSRHAGLDALRALALLPVLVVNFGSYATPWAASLMLAPRPADSPAAQIGAALATGLLEAKGVTLLSFLFGYGLVLGSRQAARLRRLLGLGVAHGLLLYYGDILGSYAVAGMMAMRRRFERLRELVRRALLWQLFAWSLGLMLVALGASNEPVETTLTSPHDAEGLSDWWLANAKMYGLSCLSLLLLLPWTYALILLGVAAARLRLLTHRRWQRQRERLAAWSAPLLVLNLIYGAWAVATQSGLTTVLTAVLAALTLPAWIAWLLQRRLPDWLVAAGRHTLSIYVSSSLLLVILLSPVGLGLPLGSLATLVLAVLLWLMLVHAAAWLTRANRRAPLEAWMAGRPS